jgi:hypothetical protein
MRFYSFFFVIQFGFLFLSADKRSTIPSDQKNSIIFQKNILLCIL